MNIGSAISAASQLSSTNASSSATSSATVASNYETFLQLLMTQLQNQDPLSPLDTNQFTQQLIQYSQIEQQIESNKNLASLVQLSSANATVSLVNYVGREVTIEEDTATLTGGEASWKLTVPESASNVTYVVSDASGNEVYSETGELSAGSSNFVWDGSTTTGSKLTSGEYTLTISATNSAGDTVGVKSAVNGIVQGVDMTGDAPVLIVAGKAYSVDDVLAVNMAK